MTYSGPLRMHKLDIAGLICANPGLQCAHCFQLLITCKRFQCSNCKCTCYCSAHCQQQNWKFHQKECKSCNVKQQSMILFERLQQECNQQYDEFCNSPNLLAIVQLPAGILQPIQYSYINNNYFVRFLLYCRNITLSFSNTFNTFVYPEGQQLYLTTIDKVKQQYILPVIKTFQPLNMEIVNYFNFKCKDENCKAQAYDNCIKCGIEHIITEQESHILLQFNQILNFAFFYLQFPKLDITGKYIKCPFIEELQESYKKSSSYFKDLSTDNFVPTVAILLKTNIVHHMSLGIFYINLYVLEQLLKINTSFKDIDSYLHDVKIHTFCLGLYKSLKHYFMNSYIYFIVLRKIVQLMNFYTMNQLETKGPAPLQQEFGSLQENMASQGLQFSNSELERMQSIAKQLLSMQKVCLGFAEDLKEFADTLGDEKVMNETDNLVGQVDCRVENLESWLEIDDNQNQDYEEIPDMMIKGQQYAGEPDQKDEKQQIIDIVK